MCIATARSTQRRQGRTSDDTAIDIVSSSAEPKNQKKTKTPMGPKRTPLTHRRGVRRRQHRGSAAEHRGDDSPGDPGYSNVNNFEPGARYFFTLDGGTQTTPSGGQCGPVHLDTHGITANLWLHIPNGPSTHQILALSNGREVGSQII